MDLHALSVLSFNVRGLNNPRRRLMVRRFLLKHKPDLICIQEPRFSSTISMAALESYFPGYRVYTNLNVLSAGGVLTLAPVDTVLQVQHHSNCINSCIVSKVYLQEGLAVSLYNIYGPSDSRSRSDFFRALIAQMEVDPLPKVLIGDFNVLPSRDKAVWSRLNSLSSVVLLSPTLGSGAPQAPHTYFRKHYKSCIDHCFVPFSSPFYSRLQLLPLYFSDHAALFLTFSLHPPSCSPPHSRWHDFRLWQPPHHLLSSPEFVSILSDALCSITTTFHSLSVSARWSLLKTHLKCELLHLHLRSLAGLRAEVSTLSKDLILEFASVSPDGDRILELQGMLQRAYAKRLRESFAKLKAFTLLNRERPSRFFFRCLHFRHQRITIRSLVDPVDPSRILSHPGDILHALHCHYSSIFDSHSASSFPDIIKLFTSPPSPPTVCHSRGDLSSLPLLLHDLTIEEFRVALRGHPGSSASGPDGLGSVFYHAHQDLVIPLLVSNFSSLVLSSFSFLLPFFSPTTISVLVPKKHLCCGSRRPCVPSVSDFRIISTSNYDLRLLARVVNARLGRVMSSTLHPRSFAIRGRNIHHSSLIQFVLARHHSGASRSSPQLLKLDLANAFDHTSIFHLSSTFLTLYGSNVTSRLLFYVLYRRCVLLKMFSECSEPFLMVNGILQGCPLSSSLYSIYLSPLLHSIDRRVQGLGLVSSPFAIKSLSYVDDLVVGCSSASDALAAIQVVRDFQCRTRSPINMRKTFSFHLGALNSRFDRSFSTRNSSRTLSQRILGHYLLPAQESQRKEQRLGFLSYFSSFIALHSTRALSIGARVKVINSMIISRLLYHCVFLRFPVAWLTKFYKLVRSFVWKSLPYVALSKLFLPKQFGGLGLINVRLLFSLVRVRFAFSIPVAFSANPPLASYLFSAYCSYFHVYDLVSSLSGLVGVPICAGFNLQYGCFVRAMCVHASHPSLSHRYLSSFKSLYLSPGQLTFMFMLQHHCLPVSEYLRCVKGLVNISVVCTFCSAHSETFSHLFFDCPVVMSIISPFLATSCVSIDTYHCVLTSTGWAGISLRRLKFCIVLAFAIWRARCVSVFSPNSSGCRSIQYFYNSIFIFDKQSLPPVVFRTLW